MCDIEVISIAVEKHPCIWDITNEDYHNRDMKDLAWNTICSEMFTDFESMDYNQKKKKCADLKKKWTNVRDCYRKDVQKSKNLPSGSAANKQKRYVYADVLSFLDPVFDRRNSDGNYTNPDETQAEVNIEDQTEEQNFQPSPSGLRETVITQIKKRKKDVPNQILDILNQRNQIKRNVTYDEDDDDTKFLLSFRSDMKKMNTRDKLDFKIEMLTLVKGKLEPSQSSMSSLNYRIPQNPTPSPSHYSSSTFPVYSQIPNIQNPTPSSSHYSSLTTSSAAPNSRAVVIKTVGAIPTYLPQPRRNLPPRKTVIEEDCVENYLIFNKKE